jgi:hypothetical protein
VHECEPVTDGGFTASFNALIQPTTGARILRATARIGGGTSGEAPCSIVDAETARTWCAPFALLG